MDRRQFLTLAGGASGVALAGCLGGGAAPTEPRADEWLSGVPNFDGFEDYADTDEVTVAVGAGDDGFLFAPPAITVEPETTVVWEWTGNGGQHVVAEADKEWQNPEGLLSEAGHRWSRKFTEAGTHRYECWPHSGLGMKAAVFVDATGE